MRFSFSTAMHKIFQAAGRGRSAVDWRSNDARVEGVRDGRSDKLQVLKPVAGNSE